MAIDDIREKLAQEIMESHEFWGDTLSNTNPGNYGADYWEVEIDFNDIWVDIPKRTFTFKNALFTFDLRMGATNEGGFDQSFSKTVEGKGKFDFDDGNVKIDEMTLETYLDLFEED